MADKQKVYTTEFKREAVRLLETSSKRGAQIAQELGISDSSLISGASNWSSRAR